MTGVVLVAGLVASRAVVLMTGVVLVAGLVASRAVVLLTGARPGVVAMALIREVSVLPTLTVVAGHPTRPVPLAGVG